MKTQLLASIFVNAVIANRNHVKEWVQLDLKETHHGWFYTSLDVDN